MAPSTKSDDVQSNQSREPAPQNVRAHRFVPSGRILWTVVGNDGDHLVDDSLHYCSCSHFYYRVLGGKDSTCHHLDSLQVAKATNSGTWFEFDDSEYASFLTALLGDLSKEIEFEKDRAEEPD